MLCILIPILLLVCWLLPAATGGMGLKQPLAWAKDVDLEDTATCQFNSALHSFILNYDLNRFARRQLTTRVTRHGENFWKPLIELLRMDQASKTYPKISGKTQYFPVDVFGTKLCRVVDKMHEMGYPWTKFSIYHFLLSIIFIDDIFSIEHYLWFVNMPLQYEDPRTNTTYTLCTIMPVSMEKMPLKQYSIYPARFFANLYAALTFTNFECLFVSYNDSVGGGHIFPVTKTITGYSFNNDIPTDAITDANLSTVTNAVFNEVFNVISNQIITLFTIVFITKSKIDVQELLEIMDNTWCIEYDKLADDKKKPIFMTDEDKKKLLSSLFSSSPQSSVSSLE